MPNQQITAWSYSRYADYIGCPYKAFLKHVKRMKEPPNDAMQRGIDIHKKADDYILGRVKAMPSELSMFKELYRKLREAKAIAEASWALTKNWTPTEFFSPSAWLRIKVDAHYVHTKGKILDITDHKTGKEKESHQQQRSIYAMAGFIIYPAVDIVTARMTYLDQGNPAGETYKRTQLPGLQKMWLKNTKAMLTDTTFAPKPGRQCDWCAFSKRKGGPCKF